MKKVLRTRRDPDMLDEYDFSKGVRGKYAKRYAEGTNIVVLSPDVAEVFPNSDSVNEALRVLVKVARQKSRKSLHKAKERTGQNVRKHAHADHATYAAFWLGLTQLKRGFISRRFGRGRRASLQTFR